MYGLNGHDPHTLDQVGNYFGLTRERIRQLTEKFFSTLRSRLLEERGKKARLYIPSLSKHVSRLLREQVEEQTRSEPPPSANFIQIKEKQAEKVAKTLCIRLEEVQGEDLFHEEHIKQRRVLIRELYEVWRMSFNTIALVLKMKNPFCVIDEYMLCEEE